jgi:hypothetical protein
MRSHVGAILLLLTGAACSSTDPSDPNDLNILLNNQTGRLITVELTIGGTLRPGISVNNGAFVSDEFSGGTPGQAITIKATTNDGNPVLTATRSCTPKSTIFGGTAYGQIDFGSVTTSGILCQDPNTWEQ